MADNNKVKRPKIRTFYAANRNKSLGALDISFNSKDGSVYMKFAPQIAYHENERAKGEYGWKDSINVKLDVGEVGSFIRALRTDSEYSFVHDFQGTKTTGGVKYYTTDRGGHGFGFHAKKGDKEVKVPIPTGDGELILEYLRFCLDHIFSADYAAEKAYWKSVAEAKNTVEGKAGDATAADAPTVAVASDNPDDDNPF